MAHHHHEHHHSHPHHGGCALVNAESGAVVHSGLEAHYYVVNEAPAAAANAAYASATGTAAAPLPKAVWSMGASTLKVPMALHAETRAKLVDYYRAHFHAKENTDAVVLLEGGKLQHQYDTDREMLFRQESFFMYLFGVTDPDCYAALDIRSGESTLFVPELDPSYAIWEGVIHPQEYFRIKYEVTHVRFVNELKWWFGLRNPEHGVHVLTGVNSDSKSVVPPANFDGLSEFKVDSSFLHAALSECRLIKTPKEIEVMRYVNKVSSDAHARVMAACRPGMMEYQLESLFLHETYSMGGCRFAAYNCICGAGHSGATLHYGQNSKAIRENDMMLLDMGAEYHGYVSDITRSYPANGKFSPNQRFIYETVRQAQKAVMDAMRPGVKWTDMHLLAERTILEQLKAGGLLQGSVDEMIEACLGYVFMPHGLGHQMGLDTHDVGGYRDASERSERPGLRNLRTNRVLAEGMVLTVEPGVYFVEHLLKKAFADPAQSKFLVKSKLDEFRGFGGVRLEDDVLVTATGYENLTTVPVTIEEVEAIMAAGAKSRSA